MVSVLALSVVGRGSKPLSVQSKDYAIGKFCFSTKYAAFEACSIAVYLKFCHFEQVCLLYLFSEILM
jgi:hypothetical protein